MAPTLSRTSVDIATGPFAPHDQQAQPPNSIIRPHFDLPSTHLTTPQGKDVRVQVIKSKRKGRPDIGYMIFTEGRATVLIENDYKRNGSSWQRVRTKATLYDPEGQPMAVLDADLTGITLNAAIATLDAEKSRSGVNSLAQRLLQMAKPDALYAATTGPCTALWELYWAALAVAAETTALLAASIYACKKFVATECAKAPPRTVAAIAAGVALSCGHSVGRVSTTKRL